MQKLAYVQDVNLRTVDDCFSFLELIANGVGQHIISQDDARTLISIVRASTDLMKHRDSTEILERLERLEEQLKVNK